MVYRCAGNSLLNILICLQTKMIFSLDTEIQPNLTSKGSPWLREVFFHVKFAEDFKLLVFALSCCIAQYSGQ